MTNIQITKKLKGREREEERGEVLLRLLKFLVRRPILGYTCTRAFGRLPCDSRIALPPFWKKKKLIKNK